jgi:hypothetical protein
MHEHGLSDETMHRFIPPLPFLLHPLISCASVSDFVIVIVVVEELY